MGLTVSLRKRDFVQQLQFLQLPEHEFAFANAGVGQSEALVPVSYATIIQDVQIYGPVMVFRLAIVPARLFGTPELTLDTLQLVQERKRIQYRTGNDNLVEERRGVEPPSLRFRHRGLSLNHPNTLRYQLTGTSQTRGTVAEIPTNSYNDLLCIHGCKNKKKDAPLRASFHLSC